ncbi:MULTISPECIES: sugar ABC transporter ATP-binding protein [Rhodomicrobium]|uniref:sugar ABC transporter ATP-binding protein n=1 Tax=Rhodomicrobium TaxID=1068 RepID=UPI000B4A99E2|nr:MULTISPECIES: sugar ABC transporter ATP-binding protein [Rhodomicrobium]
MQAVSGPVLETIGVSKRFGGVQALSNVDFACRSGRIHALLGENGAGKSTLIKIIAGVVQRDAGRMLLGGEEVVFATPREASAAGIGCIFQELSLMPHLSVADNICITDPPRRWGFIDGRAQRHIAADALARAGAEDINPSAPVSSLPLSRRQMVEIAKSLARDPKLLILDEATSALTAADVTRVFKVLKRLREEGLAIIYISHRMSEIAELADDCSVFRNGQHVATFPAGTKSNTEVVEMMIGREYSHAFPPKPKRDLRGVQPALETRGLSWESALRDVSIAVRPGEILGLGGLDGQGQMEMLLALFGALSGVGGETLVEGRPVTLASPQSAKACGIGIALIPEDRKTDGLMLPMSVRDNLTFAALDSISTAGIVSSRAENAAVADMVKLLGIRMGAADDAVGTLSGGNQQKVVIAKWLLNKPGIILLNDPTRGIDVATKQELYQLLRRLADEGAAIILYSTDYYELIGCCDRVAVFYDGQIVRLLEGDQITERALIASALNISTADQGDVLLGEASL